MAELPSSHFHSFEGHGEFESSNPPPADKKIRDMFSQTQIEVHRKTAFHDHPVVIMVVNFMQKVHIWEWRSCPVWETIFPFLRWNLSPEQFDIDGLNDSIFKRDGSNGLLAKSFYNRCGDGGILNDGKFNSSISYLNSYFNKNSAQLYAEYFRYTCRVSPSPEYVIQYKRLLLSKEYRTLKQAQSASGSWANASMEIFIHFTMLLACGASGDEVASIYDSLISGPCALSAGSFPSITRDGWKSYRGWLSDGYLDWGDLKAHNLTDSFRLPEPFPSVGISAELFYVFGNRFDYWKPSGGSCFSGESPVVLADGTTKDISTVQKGDRVISHTFERGIRTERVATVSFVSKPKRSGRNLFSYPNAPKVKFTETHPLVKADDGGVSRHCDFILNFVNPELASSMNPSWKSIPSLQILPESINRHKAGPNDLDEILYDLVFGHGPTELNKASIAPGPTIFSVADPNGESFLTASEAPVFQWIPYTMKFFESMLRALLRDSEDIEAMAVWLTNLDTVINPPWAELGTEAAMLMPQTSLIGACSDQYFQLPVDAILHAASGTKKTEPQAIADAFESLQAQLGPIISHEILSGWIYFPPASLAQGDNNGFNQPEAIPILLLNSFHLLGLTVPPALPSEEHRALNIRLTQNEQEIAALDVDALRQGWQTFEIHQAMDLSAAQKHNDYGYEEWDISYELTDRKTGVTYHGRSPARERAHTAVGLGATARDQHGIMDVKVSKCLPGALKESAGWNTTKKMRFSELLGEYFAKWLATQHQQHDPTLPSGIALASALQNINTEPTEY